MQLTWIESLTLQPDGRYTIVYRNPDTGLMERQTNMAIACHGERGHLDGETVFCLSFGCVAKYNPVEPCTT